MTQDFEELKAKAQPFADLAFVRPLTEKEYREYKKIMKKIIEQCGGFEDGRKKL